MPFYRHKGMVMHLKLSGPKSKHPKPCVARIPAQPGPGTVQCCGISTMLCDWRLSDGQTCDAPLCPDHATEIGPDRHLCPTHLAEHRAAQPELF